MSKQELTPWFPANVLPARRGVYAVKPVNGRIALMAAGGYAYWSGSGWGCSARNPMFAVQMWESGGESVVQAKKWRGLSKEPK